MYSMRTSVFTLKIDLILEYFPKALLLDGILLLCIVAFQNSFRWWIFRNPFHWFCRNKSSRQLFSFWRHYENGANNDDSILKWNWVTMGNMFCIFICERTKNRIDARHHSHFDTYKCSLSRELCWLLTPHDLSTDDKGILASQRTKCNISETIPHSVTTGG